MNFQAEAGVAYQIAVYDAGVFTLDLMERPENDLFDRRKVIAPSGEAVEGTTLNATFESGEPTASNKTVWYGWTPDFNGPAIATLFGGNDTTLLTAFKGSSVWALQELGSSAVGPILILPFTAEVGQAIAIRVAGKSSPERYRLAIVPQPKNDNFSAAQPLTGSTVILESTTWGTTVEPGEPSLKDPTPSTGTAWWKWVAPTNGFLRLNAGTVYHRAHYRLFRGDSLSSLSPMKSRTRSGDAYPDEYMVTSGKTYYLRLQDSLLFRFVLELFPRPSNDDFSHRQVLHGLGGTVHGDNFLASRQGGEPRLWSSQAGRSVWWSWTAPMTGHFYVTTIGSDFNNVIAVYTGEHVKGLVRVADNHRAYWTSVLGFPVTAGNTYHIAVDGVIERDPEYVEITRGKIQLGYAFTTLRFASPTNGSIFVGPTNVTLEIAPPTQSIDGRIVSAEFYAPYGFGVYSLGRAPVAPFSLTLESLAPDVYVIGAAVSNHLGEVRLVPPVIFSVRPPNDDFSQRIQLPSISGQIRGYVGGGSWEPGEKRPALLIPNVGSSWWVWTAPETRTYNAQIITITSIMLYQGSGEGVSSLRPLARLNYGYNQFQAEAGETYYLQAFSPARPGKDEISTAIEFFLTR